MAAAPNISNYSVLKATVTFNAVDLGNCTEIELTPESDTLDHFSSRAGVKSIDKTVLVSKKLTVRIVMDEWSIENVKLATLTPATGTANIYSLPEREGPLVITGTNDVGVAYTWTLPSVSFLPTGSINLISDEWGTMEITGSVNSIADVFGTVAVST